MENENLEVTVESIDEEYTQTSKNGTDRKLQLITLYRSHKLLWDVKSPDYHNKHKREIAISQIAKALQMSPASVKSAINSLRCQFAKHHKDATARKPTGTGGHGKQKAQWWLYNELLFLADSLDCRTSNSNVQSVVSSV